MTHLHTDKQIDIDTYKGMTRLGTKTNNVYLQFVLGKHSLFFRNTFIDFE